MYVCICRAVTDTRIRQEVAQGAGSLRELNQRLGVASQCGRCGRCARKVLKEALDEQQSAVAEMLPVPA
jgi:bacterioferritin-associated ferredoxin